MRTVREPNDVLVLRQRPGAATFRREEMIVDPEDRLLASILLDMLRTPDGPQDPPAATLYSATGARVLDEWIDSVWASAEADAVREAMRPGVPWKERYATFGASYEAWLSSYRTWSASASADQC